jgi:hypothetical protein
LGGFVSESSNNSTLKSQIEKTALSILGIGNFIMAQFILSYAKLFKSANEVVNNNSVARKISEKWQFEPHQMETVHNRFQTTSSDPQKNI